MRIAVLGPLEVRAADGTAIDVRGGRLRALVARLALDAGRPVGVSTLVDALWGDDPPAAVHNALQSLVSRLRTALGSTGAVASGPAGYTLAGAEVDATEFERLVGMARSCRPDEAVPLLDRAIGLWRGEALADVRDAPFAQGPAARLDDLRLAAAEDRAQFMVALGRAGEAIAELAPLAVAHPLRERTHELLIRALYAAGRQTDALTAYDALRTRLADELGVDPSARLRAVHTSVLRGETIDPQVRRTGPAPSPAPASSRRTESTEDGTGTEQPPNNLRTRLTSFVGRDEDVTAIGKLLATSRLVTLVGPGGAGKTRLATETAATMLTEPGAAPALRREAGPSPDGIWFVELAPLGEPADIAPAILSALGVSEFVDDGRTLKPGRMPTVRTARDRLLDVLAERRVTLVLDNCEHLIGGVAELAETLLTRCPALRVLTTSREPLGIEGEQLYPVGSLALPPAEGPGGPTPYPSVQLFVDRASAVNPGFTLTAANSNAVAEICRRLDGMPLAIELAAARMRSMSPEQLVERLADRFRLLTTGSRTALPRHQTLRAVVEWSWELLADSERTVARRLSVFAGGATLAAAERVCSGADVPADDVFGVLASLVDKSLLEAIDRDGTIRYLMLETVKAFSTEQLTGSGETEAVRRAHADYFRDLVEQAAPGLRTGEQLDWIARLDADNDNLLGALRYAVDTGNADLAIRLVAVLGEYWNLRGRPAEAMGWLESALAIPGPTPPRQRGYTLFMYALGSMAAEGFERTEVSQRRALRSLAEVRRLARRHRGEMGFEAKMTDGIWAMIQNNNRAAGLSLIETAQDDADPWNRSMALMMHAMWAENEGDVSQMSHDLDTALEGFRGLGDRWGLSLVQRGRANYLMAAGDHAGAVEALSESVRLLDELGTREGVAMLVIQRGQSRIELGDYDGARADLELAAQMSSRDGETHGDAFSLAALGTLERRLGNLDRARELIQTAIDRLASVSEFFAPQALSMVHGLLAGVLADQGDLDAAREHIGTALALAARAEDMPVLAATVEVAADVALAEGDAARAARLLGIAAAFRGMRSLPSGDVRRVAAAATEALGETAYRQTYDGGAGLTHAAAYAELDLVPGFDLRSGAGRR